MSLLIWVRDLIIRRVSIVMKYLIVILSLHFLSVISLAQSHQYNFSRLDNNNGLSHNQVNAIFKDSKGFMWFGTMSGLNRYDGYTFKVFTNNAGDSTSLLDNFITKIFQGPDDKIWVNTRLGLNIYDPVAESFSTPSASFLQKYSLPDAAVTDIVTDSNGVFWFVHESLGLYRYDKNTNESRHLESLPGVSTSLATHHIADMAEGPDGDLWILHRNGLLEKLAVESLQVVYKDSTLNKRNGSNSFDYRLFVDSDGDVWIYAMNEPGGVFYFDEGNGAFRHLSSSKSSPQLSSDLIRGITQDKKGTIWIGTDHGGVNLLFKETFSIDYLLSQPDNENSLSQNSIYTLYRDNSNIIWLGTVKKGINYYHEDIFKFQLYNSKNGSISNFNFSDINHFAEDKHSNLWIGTNGGGLYYYDRKSGTARHYTHDAGDPNSLSNDVIISLLIDSEQKLWIATYYGGLNCFDGRKFTHYKHDPKDSTTISDDRIWTIYEDSGRNLWIGTLGGGLERFDRKNNRFIHYRAGQEHSIHTDEVTSILEDKDGTLFAATYFGLDVREKSEDHFTHYSTLNNATLSNDNIFSIVEDSRGLIWLATRNGLNLFNKKTRTFKAFKKEDGLPDNMILAIVEDDHKSLWMSTPNGLSNLMIGINSGQDTSFTFKNYDQSDGLQAKSFNEKAGIKTRSGELIFGGPNGFNIFKPDLIKLNSETPPIALIDFQVFNRSVKPGEKVNGKVLLPGSVSEIDGVTLKHDENMFSIEFAALNYIHPEKNQYMYMLEGFNKEWLTADSRLRKATYTNLNPGNYIFKVRASNNDGVWNEEEVTFELVILPPFWKTYPAIFLYIIITIALLFLARRLVQLRERTRFAVQQERQEAKRVHELDMMKIKFFTNISHEFRTPLTLILTPLDKLLKNTGDRDQKKQFEIIHRNGRRLLNLVNQLLDFRKIEVQGISLNPSEGDIVKFIREVAHSFSDLAEKKSIKFSFHSAIPGFTTFFDQDKLEKILFNLLSNAFKFTPEHGSVEVAVDLTEVADPKETKYLEIKVSDTGIGIPPDKQEAVFERFFQSDISGSLVNQGSGIGLSITHEFVKLHGGTIHVESATDKGSCFTVKLPLKPSEGVGAKESVRSEVVLLQAGEQPDKISPPHFLKKRTTVLIVEDNEDFRFYLKDNLRARYRVLEASNGKEGLAKVTEHLPDLVVSDIAMPEIDGLELCRRIKNDKRTAHIPVILLTARADEEQVKQGYNTGATDYITKPFNFEILVSRIRNILVQKEALKKAFREKTDITPKEMEIISLDDKLIRKAMEIVEQNISNAEFSVTDLSRELSMSRAQLYKKIHAITGKSPISFIRTIRLKRAVQLLRKSQLTIAEVAYEVGYNDPKYFTRSFKSEFKKLPSAFVNSEQP